MYKDKDKQKQAVKKATQRYRAKKGDSAIPGSKEGLENARGLPRMDEVGDTLPVIPSNVIPKGVTGKGLPQAVDPDVQAIWDRRNAQGQASIYVKPYLEIEPVKPVLPGDPDYDGVCLDAEYDSHRRAEVAV